MAYTTSSNTPIACKAHAVLLLLLLLLIPAWRTPA
jgi:hypothetical protein